LKDKEEKILKAKQEVIQKESGNGVKKVSKSQFNEQEWVDRFTKREAKKATYQDPNTTFKPTITKRAEKLAKKSNAFADLIEDSKKRLEKEKELAQQQHKVENVKAQEGSVQMLYKKFEKEVDRAFAQAIEVIDITTEGARERVKFTQDPSVWRNLENSFELHLFLRKLGFVEEE
jgi:hypothetical protein